MERIPGSCGDDGEEPLALLEGAPIHVHQWPSWPRAGKNAQRAILNVLHSDKWTVSGRSRHRPSRERQFADAFARYVGRRHGLACASGTAALTAALQALEVGPGDEVVVPGLTWVACASAVLNLGATPILVDADPMSLCAALPGIEAAIGPATKAVLGVHMYASRIDLPALQSLCASRGIPVVEDASQAHGARIGERRTGAFGAVSIFSFQQSKLLTSGEGGIAVTDDEKLYRRMQQFRTDGRLYADPQADASPFAELAVGGEVIGRNSCMTEFQAVLLQEGLERLDVENAHRRRMAGLLQQALDELGWVTLLHDRLEPAEGATFYKIPLRLNDERLVDLGPTLLARALSAELNLAVEPLDWPLNHSPLFPRDHAMPAAQAGEPASPRPPFRFELPVAAAAWRSTICLPHACLLGGELEIRSIVAALRKLRRNVSALEGLARQQHGGEPTICV